MSLGVARPGRAAIALLAALTGSLAAQAPDGPTIIGRASHIYKALGSFQAEFKEHLTDPAMGDEDYKGVIAQSGPSHFAMRWTNPAAQAVIMDGTNLWIYTPVETPKQVLKTDPPTGPTYGSNLLGFFLDNPNDKYRSTWVREESVDGHACDAILLTPTSPDVRFRRATIWLDRDASIPRRLQIEEKTGVTRTLNFTNIHTNERIPPAMFKFDLPSGVRIVTQS